MTYEYLCQSCGHQWEAQQSISADPLKDCPKCGEASAKRQISRGGGFILKGGGWYSDLYSSTGGPSAKSGSESSSSESSASSSDTSTKSSSSESSTSTTPAAPAKPASSSSD